MFKLTWFVIGWLASTATHMIGFIKRTRNLQKELGHRQVDLGDKFWNKWIGF
ncbi:MAG: hypothetical protein WC621_05005 [Patescibacteria group bacterium]